MTAESPERATARAHDRLDRGRMRPAITTVVVGLAVAAGTAIVYPQLVVYLVGVAVAGLGLRRLVVVVLTDRRRAVGLVVVAVLVAGAVAVPWWLAEREQSGSPHWTLPISEVTREVVVDGDRVIAADDDGIFAVTLADGAVEWEHDDLGPVVSFQLAADGFVLARSSEFGTVSFAWISPDGEVLWQHDHDDEAGALAGVNLYVPQASADGVLVAPRCDTTLDDDSCTSVGIGLDGEPIWTVDGYEGIPTEVPVPELSVSAEQALQLPRVAVIETEPHDEAGSAAVVVSAATGATVHEIELGSFVAASGDVVVHGTGARAADGTCAARGVSLDGAVDWAADVPCPDGDLVMGSWFYGGVEEEVDGVSSSFALDMTTGDWRDVGGLSWFNVDVDSRTGVPGPGLVVQRLDQRLTGLDPATGEELWQLTTPGEAIPGVDVGRDAVSVLTRAGQGHNPFFGGQERQGSDMLLAVDAATGQVTGRLVAQRAVWTSVPAGPGQVVVVLPGEMSLIGSAPS